jgi:LysR family transcriptional regulator for metE and metH
MLEIKHLKTLRALRDGGSLVEAAKQLHLTQSALSHQLKEVEGRIGLSLFVRKTKPIRFSRAGEHVLELADKVIPQFEQTSRDIKKLAGGQAGRLHMAIECHSCFDWLMPAINSFRDQWPEVEIDLMASFLQIPFLCQGFIISRYFAIKHYWPSQINIPWWIKSMSRLRISQIRH